MSGRSFALRRISAAVCVALSVWGLESAAQLQNSAAAPRLSDWLLERDPLGSGYLPGLSWQVPKERGPQLTLKLELLRTLSAPDQLGLSSEVAAGLAARLSAMPVTGRVPVASADARWLQANPRRDPRILPGHRVELPVRPRTVSLLTASGTICRVDHAPGRSARWYVEACAEFNGDAPDWAWVAQPDGRVDRYGIAHWNGEAQDLPAPGAWIWAPSSRLRFPEGFSARLIQFLATQGPAPDAEVAREGEAKSPVTAGAAAEGLRLSSWVSRVIEPPAAAPGPAVAGQGNVAAPLSRDRDLMLTSNDYGVVGLLQTPSARMRPEGSFAFSASRVSPYLRLNVIAQPFSWLEAGFRYTDISNRAYGPANFSGDQSYKDKGFDAKISLWDETRMRPALALGFIDFAGTGLFSSEYLVASKRWGDFDFSLGAAWGNMAGAVRQRKAGSQGGDFNVSNYFSGRPEIFGGVQWMVPGMPLVFKAEYDPNNYRAEPLGNVLEQRSRWNLGLTWRQYPWLDWTLGYERGRQWMVGVSLHTDFSKLYTPKLNDPPRVPVAAGRPQGAPDWANTARDLRLQTGWPVGAIRAEGSQLAVVLDNPRGTYWDDRVERAASVLHRDAPAGIDRFVLQYQARGLPMAEQVVEREAWVESQTQWLPPSQRRELAIARSPQPAQSDAPVFQGPLDPWTSQFRIGYAQNIGGPDDFVLFQVYAEQAAQMQLLGRRDTWLSGALQLRLADNYGSFDYTAPSNLPRVRTFLREYLTNSRLTMPHLQLTHARQLSTNQYASAYAGYLEEMFAGAGGEWLYRPFGSRFAFGIDANWVRQRGFGQNFALRNPGYEVVTGHGTLYWDTGWHGVDLRASAGRYLAKDIGVTVEASRRFSNGVVFGAFATKTDVSAQQFGEGSFDKGIFISIPFDAMFTRSSPRVGTFDWKPLTRDGGAKLWRRERLYDITRTRDLRTFETISAPPPNENVIPVDRVPRWQPELVLPVHQSQGEPAKFTDWQASGSAPLPLAEALSRQGFRNVAVEIDGAHRLNVSLAHESLKPLSLAVGRAARTALNLAPQDAREIRIQFAEQNAPLVEYDFFDLRRLRAHLAGELPADALRDSVAVRYLNPAARETDPLARLADAAERPATPAIRDVVPSILMPGRVLDDFGGAIEAAGRVNWLGAAGVGAAAVLGSSILDSRGQRFAKDHANSQWLRQFNRVGGALPWVGLAGAGLLALDSSDPRRQRTAFAAGEAGVTAAVAATGLKYVFGRSRPGYGSRKDFNWMDGGTSGRDSFPSRQAAMAWALATPFAEEYRAPWLYGLAAVTSLSRAGKQQHWVSDVVGGSLLGYGIGQLFWQSSRRNSNMPQVMINGEGVELAWTFQ